MIFLYIKGNGIIIPIDELILFGVGLNHPPVMNHTSILVTRCPGFYGKKLTQSWEIWRE